jgi:hypothetical protein
MSGNGAPLPPQSPGLEAPDMWARMGRGVADWYEPAYSYLLAHPDPESGADPGDPAYAAAQTQYNNERKADEALYLRGLGLLGGTPSKSGGAAPSDPWRELGRQGVAAPLILAGGGLSASASGSGREALMSLMLNSGLYNALSAAGQRLNTAPKQQ